MTDTTIPAPYACRWCPNEKRVHGRRYSPEADVHSWTPPTQEQIKARMLARRAERTRPMKRTYTRDELAKIGIPPASPQDIEYSDVLLADEPVTTLKYTQLRRVIFRDGDGQAWAVEYQAALDAGDYEIGEAPDDHGWYGEVVEAIAVEQRAVTVLRWLPTEETS